MNNSYFLELEVEGCLASQNWVLACVQGLFVLMPAYIYP